MNKLQKIAAALIAPAALLAACASGDKTNTQYQDMGPASTTASSTAPANAQPQAANSQASGTPSSAPTTTATSGSSSWTPNAPSNGSSAPATSYPKGIPVPGKPGFVRSPYAEHAGLVDVQGFPSGSQVKCPYTGKIFIVP